MPPPKRPFTTSSLTSSIKSTIASQPLLQNLTNIDRLSSQASNLAQKAPFFGAINQQFQNHQNNNATTPISSSDNRQEHQHQQQQQQQQQQAPPQHHLQHQASISTANNNNNGNENNYNMMRAGPSQQPQAAGPKPPMASTPTVDMSHLTEEERLMIQSVMAKAEMADMGLPVDTSAPSSTNLPSTTSQILAQQTRERLANQEHQQHMANQMMRQPNQQQENYPQQQQHQQASMNPQLLNQAQLNQPNQNYMQQQPQQQQPPNSMMMSGGGGGDLNANDFSRQLHQQQQQQQPPQTNMMNNQQAYNLQQQRQHDPNQAQNQPNRLGQQYQFNSFDNTSRGQLPSLEQQTQQLVSQINSQFNLGGAGQQGGQQPQVQPSQLKQVPSIDLSQDQVNRMQQQQQVPNINNQSSFGQVPLQQRQQQQHQLENLQAFPSQQFDGTSMNKFQPPQQQHQQARQMQDNMQQMGPQFNNNTNNSPNLQTNMMMAQHQPGSFTPNQQEFALQQASMIAPEATGSLIAQPQQLQQNPLMQQNMMIPQQQQQQPQPQPMNQAYQQELMLRNQLQPTIGPSSLDQTFGQPQDSLVDARQNICFGPATRQPAARGFDASYDHPLSDQELQYHQEGTRRGARATSERGPVKRYDSADVAPGGQRSRSGRRSRNRDEFESRDRDLQAYDLAQRAPNTTSRQKSRVLPQPGSLKQQYQRQQQQQVAGERSLQSSFERLQEERYTSPTQAKQKAFEARSKPTLATTTTKRNVARSDAPHRRHHKAGSKKPTSARYHSSDSEENIEDDENDELEEEEDDLVSLEEEERNEGHLKRNDKQANSKTSGSTTTTTTTNTSATANKQQSSAAGGVGDSREVDKSDKALQLLSELKLTEQANQVMEQQQLLIKQSQELIKLQQAQLEQQQTLKQQESSNKSQETQAQGEATKKQTSVDDDTISNEQNNQEESKARRGSGADMDNKQEAEKMSSLDDDDKKPISRQQRERQEKLTSKKATSFLYDRNSGDESEETRPKQQPARESVKKRTASLHENEHENDSETSRRDTNKNIRPAGGIKKSTNLASKQTANVPSPRYNRDLLQSPTDTTDSDVDLISSSHSAIHRRPPRQAASGPGSSSSLSRQPRGYVRRREPTGLPPSPLPVAAAIQLHHMQQQHLKNQQLGNNKPNANNSNFSRANFLRSRSVTNSPNHLLERANSGYMTDSQHAVATRGILRPSSPETLSEYGGQRLHGRKRLPVPPQNAVPITPSMVRKMVQAQKVAAASSGKLLTSVNAQSTLLTNMHSTRNPSLDRPLADNSLHHDSQRSKSQTSMDFPSTRSVLLSNNNARFRSTDLTSGANNPSFSSSAARPAHDAANNADLNKFLTSTYGNSILKNSPHQPHHSISDVKETPELDKLISNLDEYYGLDGATGGNRSRQQQPTRFAPQASSLFGTARSAHFGATSVLCSPTRQPATAGPLSQQFGSLRSPLASGYPSAGGQYRRNSDGEFGTGLASLGASRVSYGTSGLGSGRPALYGQSGGVNYTDDSRSKLGSGRYSAIDPRVPYSSMGTTLGPNSGQHHLSSLRHQYPSISREQNPSSSLGDQARISSPYHERQVAGYNYQQRPLGQPHFLSTTTSRYPPAGGSFDTANSALSSPYQSLDHYSPAIMSSTYPDQQYKALMSQQQQQHQPVASSSAGYRNPSNVGYQPGLASRLDTHGNHHSSYQPSSDYNHPRGRPLSQAGLSRGNFRELQYGSVDLDSRTMNATGGQLASNSFDSRPLGPSSRYFNSQVEQHNAGHPYEASQYGQYNDLSRAGATSGFAPFTKDDIIRNGPKFNSIGYRFRTENQNKYVAESRAPIDCLQTKYPHPYKRILLSKNPKDRIGNGIGVRITGGQTMPNLYDKVNRCIITSGAFVTEVFQSSNVYLMDELHEGDQIIEWNGVNLCNRSDEEVQQILLSQFSDDEVEIVYLNRDKFHELYGTSEAASPAPPAMDHSRQQQLLHEHHHHHHHQQQQQPPDADDPFETFSKLHKPQTYHPQGGSRYASEPLTGKGSLRRKLSLSSISHMWSR